MRTQRWTRRSSGRGLALGAAALVVAGALTACSGDDDPKERDTAPASGASGGNIVQLDPDGLPHSYPRDDAPLVEGDVVSAIENGKKDPGWTVVIHPSGTPAAALGQAVQVLSGAGWQPLGSGTDTTKVLKQGSDRVIVQSSQNDGETLLTYSVRMD